MSVGLGPVGLGIEQLDTPSLLVDLDALEGNIGRAARLFAERGVGWRPHIKGQRVPAIAHMQLEAGATGVTCAKVGEAEVMVAAGLRSVLIANQIIGESKVARVAGLCRRARVIVAVDSREGVEQLAGAARRAGVVIGVVVELDIGMERAGVVPGEPALQLSQLVAAREGLEYLGLMGWEGHARRISDPTERQEVCRLAVGQLVETAQLCRSRGLPVEIVSCAGTGTHQYSTLVAGITEVQAGGIVFNDAYYSALGLDYPHALTVLSTVSSRPNDRRIITDAGRKSLSADAAMPVPIGLEGVSAIQMSAEHSVIQLEHPAPAPAVGDQLRWIVGYGDTTVFLHEQMLGVRGGRVELVWSVLPRGRSC